MGKFDRWKKVRGKAQEDNEVYLFQVELGEKLCGIKEDDSFILDRWGGETQELE